MTFEERQALCTQLAEKQTDTAPIEVLMQLFYENQLDYFDGMTDEELKKAAEDILK